MSEDDSASGKLIKRDTARALIQAASDCSVLLINMRGDNGEMFWITPGGGIDDGESPEEAVIREIREETGFEGLLEPQLIANARNSFTFNGCSYEDDESLYHVKVPKFTPSGDGNPCTAERESSLGFKWWDISALLSSGEMLKPERLGKIIAEL